MTQYVLTEAEKRARREAVEGPARAARYEAYARGFGLLAVVAGLIVVAIVLWAEGVADEWNSEPVVEQAHAVPEPNNQTCIYLADGEHSLITLRGVFEDAGADVNVAMERALADIQVWCPEHLADS